MENKKPLAANIQLNNARSIVDKLMSNEDDFCEDFLTMIPTDLYDVGTSYENLVNNAKPVVNPWD